MVHVIETMSRAERLLAIFSIKQITCIHPSAVRLIECPDNRRPDNRGSTVLKNSKEDPVVRKWLFCFYFH